MVFKHTAHLITGLTARRIHGHSPLMRTFDIYGGDRCPDSSEESVSQVRGDLQTYYTVHLGDFRMKNAKTILHFHSSDEVSHIVKYIFNRADGLRNQKTVIFKHHTHTILHMVNAVVMAPHLHFHEKTDS